MHVHMRPVKRMDSYLLKAYLQLFAGTFFISLFILLMQFMWRYVNDLVGKGLSLDVLAEFFWYATQTLVPMSFPLAVLLASLITFGNFGERLELLSMKAAGISLLRILRPIFLFVLLVSGISFYFQNRVTPEATKQLAALVNSMKQKSPELEIPEGTFYQIEKTGYNFFVERKDMKTGMLYGIMIYNTTSGYQDMQIVLADSGRLQTTADRQHLKLTLYGGERFQNLQNQGNGNMMKASIPYMRETFLQEVDLIQFNSEFEVMDASYFAHDARTKDIGTIEAGIDSLRHRIDSVGHDIYAANLTSTMRLNRVLSSGRKDSSQVVAMVAKAEPFDSLMAHLPDGTRQDVWREAAQKSLQMRNDCEFRAYGTDEDNYILRRHRIEWNKKFTLSLSCLLFFFIGAPLGAIIRKGGLGLPVVVSVLIFIFYYILDTSGEKMAKEGEWDVVFGVWMSTMVLAPLGAFLTYKANQDSGVFNMEVYRMVFRRLLGLRETRKLNRKEVIIEDPDYVGLQSRLTAMAEQCREYSAAQKLWKLPSYIRLFFQYKEDHVILSLNEELERIVAELHNSSQYKIVSTLNQLPILVPDAHTRPFRNRRLNMIVGILLPVGLFFYLRIWRYRIRLHRDLSGIQRQSGVLNELIGMHLKTLEKRKMQEERDGSND